MILYILAILLWISFSFRWGQQEDARPGSQGWLQTPIAEVANHYSFRSDDALGPHHQPLATIYLSDAIGKTRLKLAK